MKFAVLPAGHGVWEGSGTRGGRSAEADVLANEERILVVEDIQGVFDQTPRGSVGVVLATGQTTYLDPHTAAELGLC